MTNTFPDSDLSGSKDVIVVLLLYYDPEADFTKGLSPVSGSNLRLLSQIIGIFYLSPWAQP